MVIRLKSFPMELINNVNLIDSEFLNNFDREFPLIIEEINKLSIHKN